MAMGAKPGDVELVGLLASLYQERGEVSKAIELMQQLVARQPENDQYHFTLGVLYDEVKNKDASIAEMRRAIQLNPQNAAALNYLGYTYAEMGIELDEAERLIRQALALSPNDGFYIDSLGWVFYQRGEYDKAIQQLERALEIAGDDPTICEHLADAYVRVGKSRDALRLYQEALTRAKEGAQLERLKAKIQSLDGVRPARGDGA